jgi:hypothetical protein
MSGIFTYMNTFLHCVFFNSTNKGYLVRNVVLLRAFLRRIFWGEKILSIPSLGSEVKPFAPCPRFAACKKIPVIYVEVGIAGKIDRPFLA